MTQEGENSLLVDVYDTNGDILPKPENKPSARGDTDQHIYEYGWMWNGIDHSR